MYPHISSMLTWHINARGDLARVEQLLWGAHTHQQLSRIQRQGKNLLECGYRSLVRRWWEGRCANRIVESRHYVAFKGHFVTNDCLWMLLDKSYLVHYCWLDVGLFRVVPLHYAADQKLPPWCRSGPVFVPAMSLNLTYRGLEKLFWL